MSTTPCRLALNFYCAGIHPCRQPQAVQGRRSRCVGNKCRHGFGDKSFREGLYHRLCEFEIRQPSLVECPEDVLSLAEFFLNKYLSEMRLGCAGFTEGAKMALLSWHWPGNISEFANRVRRGVLFAEGGLLSAESLGLGGKLCACPESSLKLIWNEDEKRRIMAILDECRGNISSAAELLGCSRPTLYKKLRIYGMM